MNWVTTNIRLPEEDYMELKMLAARERKSVAEIIRARILKKKRVPEKKSIQNQIRELEKFAAQMSKKYPNLRLSEKLIEMRYEQ